MSAAGGRQAYFNLQLAAGRLRTIADREGRAVAGITAAQAGAMYAIAARPGSSQRALAKALAQRESAITTMIERLVAAGFVERRLNASDGRAWEIYLTAHGRESLGRLDVVLGALNGMIDAAIGPDCVDAFVDALESLRGLKIGPMT